MTILVFMVGLMIGGSCGLLLACILISGSRKEKEFRIPESDC